MNGLSGLLNSPLKNIRKMKNQIKNLLLIAVLLLITATAFSQKVSNVHFEQVGKRIHIYYDLEGKDNYSVQVFYSEDKGNTWQGPLEKASGDVGEQTKGNNKKIIWDVLENKDNLIGYLKFKIIVDTILLYSTGQNDNAKSPIIQNHIVKYKTFVNTHRGYKIDYPETWKPKGEPPANRDGRSFSSNQEIELIVFSHANINNTTIAEEFEKEIKNKEHLITYKRVKNNWYVISGFTLKNNKEFYKKVYRSEKYDEWRTMILNYSVKNHDKMQKVIPVLLKTFKDI